MKQHNFATLFLTAFIVRGGILALSSNLQSSSHILFLAIEIAIIFIVFYSRNKIKFQNIKHVLYTLLFNPFTLYLYTLNDFANTLFVRGGGATLDAYNFWGIIYGNEAIQDSIRISGFSIQFLGYFVSLAFSLVIFLWYFGKKTRERLIFTLCFIVLTIFLFTTQRTQLDILLLFPFIAFLVGIHKRFEVVFRTVTFISLFNYFVNYPIIASPVITFFDNWFISRLFSITMFLVFIWMYFIGRSLVDIPRELQQDKRRKNSKDLSNNDVGKKTVKGSKRKRNYAKKKRK